ncbi:MarR family transcriptional regulator [Brevibacillus laterosporus]|uniref:MarR family transcriptional regulator n=1 Tax=Brevibacillus halotolerans TaxID=1507437 RepID=A0ABT4HXH2_9BACL|nr:MULTISPECIES: MarR family transcriptional regulator [Brevibacillus]MCR8985539.1 MarR family transcriptional regulator [Brevibacillus laterosporus]MCZ0831273.1 MarR family transcriptional regulator [Brevibacillus halotolerans]
MEDNHSIAHENSVAHEIQTLMIEMSGVQQKSKAFMDLFVKDAVLSQNHVMLLVGLKLTNSLKITEIAERFFITAGAATSMCDKLEELGLVSRIRTKEDRRVVLVVLTEKGQDKINELFKGFSKEKLREMANVFKQVNELLSTIVE